MNVINFKELYHAFVFDVRHFLPSILWWKNLYKGKYKTKDVPTEAS